MERNMIKLTGASGYCPFRTKKINECKGEYTTNTGFVRKCSYGENEKCSLKNKTENKS